MNRRSIAVSRSHRPWRPLLALCAIGALAVLTAGPGQFAAAEDEAPAGFENLLPGGDFSKHWSTKGNWLSGEGAVRLAPRAGESGWTRYDSYLWSKEQYQDFEIDFEFNVAKHGNSGFYFHVGDVKEPVSSGIEVQIYDSYSRQPGDPLNDHDCGGIIPGLPPRKRASLPPGEWNRLQITVQGEKVVVKLNGELVNETPLSAGALKSRPPKGQIGFQDHGLPLSLRKIYVRKL